MKYSHNKKLVPNAKELRKNMTKEDLCRKLQLNGINIDRWHLYKIINGKVILKDFELICFLVVK